MNLSDARNQPLLDRQGQSLGDHGPPAEPSLSDKKGGKMRVLVLSFGSHWWARSETEPCRFARYNSTGIECGRKMRRHWIVPGIVRVNGNCNFRSWPPQQMLGWCFRCSEPSFAFGGNRLLLVERLEDGTLPELYLATISSAVFGRLDPASRVQRSASSMVIAASQLRERQEVMLLIECGGWFQTSSGFWQLRDGGKSGNPEIVLVRQ